LATAASKYVTIIFLKPPLLDLPDPVFRMPVKILLAVVAAVELLVVLALCLRIPVRLKLGALCLLSSQFLLNRALTGEIHYCHCIGTLLRGVPFVAGKEWLISFAMALFLFLGSTRYLLLLRGGRINDMATAPKVSSSSA